MGDGGEEAYEKRTKRKGGGGGVSGREKAVLNTEGERERESLGKNTLEGKRKRHTFFKY